jgi:hypothetical protein
MWRGLVGVTAVAIVGWPGTSAALGGARGLPDVPVVVDATGRVVGPVVGVSSPWLEVSLTAGGRVVSLTVTEDRFLAGSNQVRFESTDCSGPPLLLTFPPAPGVTRLEPPSGIGPDNVLFGESGGPEASVTVKSFWNQFLTPPGCAPLAPVLSTVVPAAPLLDLTTFTPPFSVR